MRERGAVRRVVVVVLVAAAAVLVARGALPCGVLPLQPSCYVALHPGPVEDAVDLIQVGGARTYAPAGELLLTTVAVEEDLDFLEWVRGAVSPIVDQIPRGQLYPDDEDTAQVERRNIERMGDSQLDAVVAALEYLGTPYELDRGGARDRVGVDTATQNEMPLAISIDAGSVGGPSAGLMFALSVVELLGADDLGGGRVVAGTGSIDRDGQVHAIGGVRQKVVGAQTREDGRAASVFLVPRDNLAQARDAPVDRRVLLVPVDTLEDAVVALDNLRAGRQPVDAFALAP